MSNNLKVEVSEDEIKMVTNQRRLDTVLNKTLLDLVVYSTFGYAVGIGASVLFRNKAPVRNLAAGVGGSYAYILNMRNFSRTP